ncbi:coiled-coil domain-containing protein 97 isoform X1 [Phascolarctos cinereus]|uniref:Coiled-coil domain-containing protein 97 isoform X1 n=1 Tax=Phascolarctos cinereus TaxID=38626 RepID=A0A6P5JIL1_PHACI|nr:coiled-coil domain-containing protein 97 isoform X1 [Phascolarctos cinereus]
METEAVQGPLAAAAAAAAAPELRAGLGGGSVHWGEPSGAQPPEAPQCRGPAQAEEEKEEEEEGQEDPGVRAMLRAVAGSRIPVQSQQKDEPDFTEREKVAILGRLYRDKPLVFLERFRSSLREEHLACFQHLRGDYRADFYCAEVLRGGAGRDRASRTRLRNRRYAALQELIRGGEYFSDEQMRARDPLLYEQYIGQYLSEEELAARSPKTLAPDGCPLADLLLQSYQEGLLQRRLLQQQEEEDACLEEDEDEEEEEEEEEENAGPGQEEEAWVPDSEEKVILREEFTSRMHQRFLDGKDRDFDYSKVDDNPEFDNLDIVSRDEEERYFDEEEPGEALSTELDED